MDHARRRVIAGLGAAAATGLAGCTGALGFGPDGEWKLRAMRADPDATDVQCRLSGSFVDAHPNLATVLSRADETPRGEWCEPVRLAVETGNELGRDLQSHCGGDFRGLYRYDGGHYFVSLLDVNPGNGEGHGHADDGHDHAGNATTHDH